MGILHKCFGGCGSASRKQPSASIEYLCHRFSLAQLRKATDDFDESRKIGEGPYGVAYRACISINGELKDTAVKQLRLQAAISAEGLSLCEKDIIFTCQLRHPNLLSQNREQVANSTVEEKAREISIGVARGLHYLHSGTKRTILHRNIKSAAIRLDENWVPKLTFLGFSVKGPKFSEKEAKPIRLEYFEGPMGYMAPECFSGTNVSYKCDVYSFGIVLLELICGKTLSQMAQHKGHHIDENANVFPFAFSVVKEVRDLVETGRVEGIIDEGLVGEIGGECWKLYVDITESCLREDPNERPDMGDVEVQLEHLLQLLEEADSITTLP
ncbi:receptor-like protein kinase ANXUR1 [Neltuma alba]|uniref:receptor-like protein kinase ANXUR1 n=1 Tax=Neltuma alba TaxID=207710 RepID=UPI0010A54299|nr:receptor-like protein kinase ANXUR1 [Prosopis alba]